MIYDPSPSLEAVIAAEIRNEAQGGDPVTLQSVHDSLIQMPDDVFGSLNQDIASIGASRSALLNEVKILISRLGPDHALDMPGEG